MNAVINFISQKLPILILLVAIYTYFSPYYWDAPSIIPSIFLGIVIFFTGVSMNINSIKDIRNKKREIIIATVLKYTVTVIISIILALMFFSSNPEMAAGLILAGTVPNGTAATVYSLLAGGNASLVVLGSLIDVVVSPIVTPLSMLVLSNDQVSISFFSLLKSFILIVVIPISLGLTTQKMFPELTIYSKSATKLGSALALLLIVHTIVGSGKEAIASEISSLPLLAVVSFLQVFLSMILGYYLAKKLKVRESDARAILFHVGLCNTALAAILAYQFIGEVAVIAPILGMVFNLSLGAFISNYFSKKEIMEEFQNVASSK
ncbi:bile acid:sodium symporter family protein [Calidifontibacillus erzurumensis]|uniref:Bile acid:sodium symporter family protein n=1 Tax=Calidifontibacillus erzurumensis TaxID=2741433 RepID=A0A8J8GE62_9BACI|nr:bile acid:sodium symporter family protein [Calidifontibacillus erzurumensis]NSL51869.1 bile acid:sodium symporter family protein [Calidifontibacillus erzurumensis]